MSRRGHAVTAEPAFDEAPGRTAEERAYYAWSARVYALFAYGYDLAALPLVRLRRVVVDIVDPGPGSRVLDVATGTGSQALAFAHSAREVIGVDLSEAMLRVARRKCHVPNVSFLRADATALPFDNMSFDVACISFALHEMPASVRDRVLREMVRVTRVGGTVVVVDHAPPRDRITRITHRLVRLYEAQAYEDFVRSDLAALMRGAGIEVRADVRVLLGVAVVVAGTRRAAVQAGAGFP